MSQGSKFLTSIRKYDTKKLNQEIGKRSESIRTLRFSWDLVPLVVLKILGLLDVN